MKMRFTRLSVNAFAVGLVVIGMMIMPPAVPECRADDAGVEAALNLQNAFTKIAEDASDAVVVITNKQVQRDSRGLQQLPPEFRFFFGIPDVPDQPQSEQVPRPSGRGSGFLITDNGYIVTNYHVIKDHTALEVKLRDGTVYDSERDKDAVEVVGVDRETDLAVLKIHDKDKEGKFPALEFADSTEVKVGQWSIAVGAPFNFDYSVTVGVVSQKGRHDVRMNTYENYIQTDASINPGNSGGPLLNLHGQVIGVNDFIITGGGMSRGNVGVGFAIASNLAKQVVDDIIESGSVIRPWIGIAMQELTPELRSQFGVEQGVLVSDVVEGDPADKAGIKPGDVITNVGDTPVASPHDLQFAVLKYNPGDKIPVTLLRDGKQKQVKVVARERTGTAGEGREGGEGGDILGRLGLDLQNTDRGVAIAAVAPGSQAQAANLRRGDIIHEVNHQEVDSVADVRSALQRTKGNVAVLYVARRGNKFFAPLRLESNP